MVPIPSSMKHDQSSCGALVLPQEDMLTANENCSIAFTLFFVYPCVCEEQNNKLHEVGWPCIRISSITADYQCTVEYLS